MKNRTSATQPPESATQVIQTESAPGNLRPAVLGTAPPLSHLFECRVSEKQALIHHPSVEPPVPGQAVSQPLPIALSPPASSPARRVRHGKIARLPKLERDMVNKLLHNHVPYVKIVWALGERGIFVTERNISNWKTAGGYKEWCAEQENQLRLAQIQDHLTDYLRKNDSHEIPEVGLQIAATQLTTQLLNPQVARELLADPKKYREVVEMLSKCSTDLLELKKQRDETLHRARIRDTAPNKRLEEEREVDFIRQIASAEVIAESRKERNEPHPNDLPPREKLYVAKPGPTFADLLGIKRKPKFDALEFHLRSAHLAGLDDIPNGSGRKDLPTPPPAPASRPASIAPAAPEPSPAASKPAVQEQSPNDKDLPVGSVPSCATVEPRPLEGHGSSADANGSVR